jgi:hypothetical protein
LTALQVIEKAFSRLHKGPLTDTQGATQQRLAVDKTHFIRQLFEVFKACALSELIILFVHELVE